MSSSLKKDKGSVKKTKSVKIIAPENGKSASAKGKDKASTKKDGASGKNSPQKPINSSTKKGGNASANASGKRKKGSGKLQNAKEDAVEAAKEDLDPTGAPPRDEELPKEILPPKMVLARFFCCLCCLPKNHRKLRRRRPQVLEVTIEPVPPQAVEEAAPQKSPSAKWVAAVKIQRIARGFIGRGRAQRRWEAAMYEANEFWFERLRLIVLERWRKKVAIAARKQVSFTQHKKPPDCVNIHMTMRQINNTLFLKMMLFVISVYIAIRDGCHRYCSCLRFTGL